MILEVKIVFSFGEEELEMWVGWGMKELLRCY